MNNKFIPILLLIVLLATSAFLAGYYFSGKSSDNANFLSGDLLSKFETVNDWSGNSSPMPGRRDPDQSVSSSKAVSLTLSANPDSVVYYEKTTGKVINLNYVTGVESIVTNNNLANFISSIWSPDKKFVISLFYDPAGNFYKYYNFNSKKTATFSKDIKSVAFSPNGKYITYFREGETENGIFVSSPDGTNPKNILNTRLKDVVLFWPLADYIYVQSINDSEGSTSLFKMDEAGNMTKIANAGLEMQVKFSPSGNQIIFSHVSAGQLLTGLVLKDGREVMLKQTLRAQECAWSIDEKNIYCIGVSGASTDIVKYNTEKDELTLVEPMPFNGHANTLLLSDLEDYLILHGKNDDKIYSFKLPD